MVRDVGKLQRETACGTRAAHWRAARVGLTSHVAMCTRHGWSDPASAHHARPGFDERGD